MKSTDKFKPYPGIRRDGLFNRCIVIAATFRGALVIYERPAMPELGRLGTGVCCMDWHEDHLPGGVYPNITLDEKTTLQSSIARIKEVMLKHGAQAEAVRLIGELSPFTDKELNIMAEKLKGKTPAAKVEKAPKADKAAAPAKAKGNPEALAKARAASDGKRAEARLQKIKPLKKAKEIEAREGTFRHRMLSDLLAAKTVGDFYESAKGDDKYDAGCLRFAEGAGYVTVG